MARICGICPVSHLITSAKACDMIMAVTIPETAEKLRRVMNLAQIVQSHALSFFHLSSPDFLLGFDSDPATRNIVGLLQRDPKMARDGIRMRQFGQQIIQWLGGKRVHPGWIVPGGVSEPLTVERRDQILATIPDAIAIVLHTLNWFKGQIENFREEIRTFANFPTLFLGLAKPDGGLALYKGWVRVIDSTGRDGCRPSQSARLPAISGRGGRAVVVSEVHVLQADGLSRRHLPCGPAGPAESRQALRHAAG